METYLECAKLLNELLAGARAVRITVPEYMPLSVEEIGVSQDGHRLVSLCQYADRIIAETQKPGGPAIVYGVVLILLMFVLPSGVGGLFRRIGQLISSRRYSRAE